jgi:hypothetical protein
LASLFADENFPFPVVAELRLLGHDVLTIQDVGLDNEGFADDDVLQSAIAVSRAVLTVNRRHFFRLHRLRPNHFGIIACTEDLDFVRKAGRINDILLANPDLRGKLLRVYRPSL